MSAFFKKFPFLLDGSLIFLVCLLAYGQIIGLYFFLEDYLTLYSIQHPYATQVELGSGLFWGHPDGYEVTPFIPFFHFFGLKPEGYYFVEVLLYFLAAITTYFFTKTLTDSRKIALGSALIFASGYVGSESLYRVAVGWQNLLAAIFLTLTATIYIKFVKSGKKNLYFLALVFYLFTSDFSFYRAHGIVLLILGIELLFNFKKIFSVIRMIPFVLGYWYFYVYSIRDIMDQGSKSATFIQKIFLEGNFHLLLTPLKTLENLFLPDKFNFPLLAFIVILTGILIWKRSRVLFYCLIFAVVNYLVYFYVSPENPQETTHRYLTISFVGTATFIGVLLGEIFKSGRKYFFFGILVVILNLSLVRKDQTNILQNRSQPSREFWQSFLGTVPYLTKQSVIYIDSKNDGISKPARDVAIGAGSMSATTSFAVFYGLKWEDLYLAENFKELLDLLKEGEVSPDNIYTFFYSRQDGLVNTTTDIKKAIFGTGSVVRIEDIDNINIQFYSPVLLRFSSEIYVDSSSENYSSKSGVDLFTYLSFLASRDRYWGKVRASATTETKYAEINKIIDRSSETAWKGDNITWSKNKKEEVVLDLREVRQIGGVRITPGLLLGRIPTKYSYECSLDGASWREIKSFQKRIEKLEVFTDRLDASNCAFIKLIIYATKSDAAPQISEIEILEAKFADLDVDLSNEIEKDPFRFIRSANDKEIISEYFANNGISGKICIFTDKYNPLQPVCKRYKFKLGKDDNGLFFIGQGGTILQKIEFMLPSGVKFSLNSAAIEYLSFSEL